MLVFLLTPSCSVQVSRSYFWILCSVLEWSTLCEMPDLGVTSMPFCSARAIFGAREWGRTLTQKGPKECNSSYAVWRRFCFGKVASLSSSFTLFLQAKLIIFSCYSHHLLLWQDRRNQRFWLQRMRYLWGKEGWMVKQSLVSSFPCSLMVKLHCWLPLCPL